MYCHPILPLRSDLRHVRMRGPNHVILLCPGSLITVGARVAGIDGLAVTGHPIYADCRNYDRHIFKKHVFSKKVAGNSGKRRGTVIISVARKYTNILIRYEVHRYARILIAFFS